MLEAVVVTMWLEGSDGKLSEHAVGISRNCEQTVKSLYEEYEDKPQKIVAIKCDTSQNIKLKQEKFKGLYTYVK